MTLKPLENIETKTTHGQRPTQTNMVKYGLRRRRRRKKVIQNRKNNKSHGIDGIHGGNNLKQ